MVRRCSAGFPQSAVLALAFALVAGGCGNSSNSSTSGGGGVVAGGGGVVAGGSGEDGGPPTDGGPGGGDGAPVGAACLANDDCSGPNPECIINQLVPLSELTDATEPALATLAAEAVVPVPGNYCSNVAPCETDAQCGDMGECFRPLIALDEETWTTLVNVLPGPPDELAVIADFRTFGMCLRPCETQSDCDFRAGYTCAVPLEELVGLAVDVDTVQTYCVGDPDFGQDCTVCDDNATCDDTTAPVTCTCAEGFEGDGFECAPVTVECTPACDTNAACVDDGAGAGVCVCNAGFTGDGQTCVANECDPACGANAACDGGGTCLCDDGFEGDAVAGCTDIDDCDPDPCVNGACTDTGANAYSCVCDAGFEGDNCDIDINECADGGTHTCQNGTCVNEAPGFSCSCDDGWSGDDCDVPVDCGALTAAGDLMVDTPSTTLGATATYSCGNGQVLSGAATRTCQSDGSWSGDAPTCTDPPQTCSPNPCENGGSCNEVGGVFDSCDCQPGYSGPTCGTPVDCGGLPAPSNGSVDTSGGTALGANATYSCSAGHTLSSSAGRTCQPNGSWSGVAPSCDPVDCGSLTGPSNGSVNTSAGTTFGQSATYTCDAGFDINGSAMRACGSDGSWGGMAPTCTPRDCGSLPAPANGSVDTSAGTVFGESATYACDLGYEINGPMSRSCGADGNWGGAAPTCQPVDCGPLGGPSNGMVDTSGGTTFGQDASYSCDNGYTLNGDTTRTCAATGTWSGAAPTCEAVTCAGLVAPANGSINSTAMGDFGDSRTYSCDNGYSLNGDSSRSCQADGSWSGSAPTCDAGSCGSLNAPANGSVDTSGGTSLGATASYSCDPGYDLSGDTSRTCGSDLNWSGAAPTCVIRDCGSLNAPANGSVDTSGGTEVGDDATYSCDAGYTRSGSATRTCGTDGVWGGMAPTCVIDDCGPLNGPTNGSVDLGEGTEFGASATFSCDAGYDLVGMSTRTCQAGGTWSGSTPNCQIRDCGGLGNPADGSVDTSGGTEVGDSATYSCDPGFQINGSASRTCGNDGNWGGVAPTCDPIPNGCDPDPCENGGTCTESAGTFTGCINCNAGYGGPTCSTPVDCGNLGNPANGSVDTSGGTTLGEDATYSCNSGYMLMGGMTRSCGTDGNWSGVAPTCAPVNCGGLGAPSNGSVDTSGGTTFGDSASYSCDSGYNLVGSPSRTCGSDGNWGGMAPTCAPVDCGNLGNPGNGSVDTSGGTTFGDSASYSCDAGYMLNGASSRSCGSDGSWGGVAPTCDPVDCGNLGSPSNGSVDTSGGTEFGDSASYSCDSGYNLVGSPSRTCGSDGNWGGMAPTCAPVDCGGLPGPSNGSVDTSGGTTLGDTATYSCNSGYDLSGSSTRSCGTDGNWSGMAPTCTPRDCGGLGAPANGSVDTSGGTEFGDSASYSCDSGYMLNGSATRMCAASGNWSGMAPTCDPVDCGSLTNPSNGTVDTSGGTTFGDTASYSCSAGYTLMGSSTRTCGAGGSWSGMAPTCAPVDCGSLNNPTNGTVDTSGGTTLGETATYSCSSGYTLSGGASRTCGTDGNWTGMAPSCNPVDCGALSSPANGMVSVTTTTFGSVANYSCNGGYSLNGTSSRTCQSDASWAPAAPTCELSGPQICTLTYNITQAFFTIGETTADQGDARIALHNFMGASYDAHGETGSIPGWQDGTVQIQIPSNGAGVPDTSNGTASMHYYRLYQRFESAGVYTNTTSTAGTLDGPALNSGTWTPGNGRVVWDTCDHVGWNTGTDWGPAGTAPFDTSGAGCVDGYNSVGLVFCSLGRIFGINQCAIGELSEGSNNVNDTWTHGFNDFELSGGPNGVSNIAMNGLGLPASPVYNYNNNNVTDSMAIPNEQPSVTWVRWSGTLDSMVCD